MSQAFLRLVKKKQSPNPYAPDFTMIIDEADFDGSFAIVGDSGISVRNTRTSQYVSLYDFLFKE